MINIVLSGVIILYSSYVIFKIIKNLRDGKYYFYRW